MLQWSLPFGSMSFKTLPSGSSKTTILPQDSAVKIQTALHIGNIVVDITNSADHSSLLNQHFNDATATTPLK
jgi:hypothetical protein